MFPPDPASLPATASVSRKIIAPEPFVETPYEAARRLVAEFGAMPLLVALQRDIQLATWTEQFSELKYWEAVRSAVLQETNLVRLTNADPLSIVAPHKEATQLMRIFPRIANAQARKAVMTFAISLLRHDPIDQ